MNANQLSNELELDYKTVRHHLVKLEDNNVLTSMGDEYGKTYFLTEGMEDHLDVLEDIVAKANFNE